MQSHANLNRNLHFAWKVNHHQAIPAAETIQLLQDPAEAIHPVEAEAAVEEEEAENSSIVLESRMSSIV